MGELTVKIKVTRERFDEQFSIDDWLNFTELTPVELYRIMLKFVVDDQGQPLPLDEARRCFKSISKKDWGQYVDAFYKAINDAFVNPTNGSS